MTQDRMHAFITAAELQRALNEDTVQIADCRWYLDGRSGIDAYRGGHIPTARFIDLDEVLSDHQRLGEGRHPLPRASRFIRDLQRLGFNTERPIVAYDDAAGTVAARLWWLGTELGIDVRVLNGGLRLWEGPLEVGPPPTPMTVALDDHQEIEGLSFSESVIELPALVERLKDNSILLLDARARERYVGEVEPIDPRPGHIPGAHSMPTATLLHSDGTIMEPEELRQQISITLGSTPTDELPFAASCGSGVTACFLVLAFAHAYGRRPLLYAGSYSQWSNRPELAVITGAAPS